MMIAPLRWLYTFSALEGMVVASKKISKKDFG